LTPGELRRHGADRADRLHRLGGLAPGDGAAAGGPAERSARRRHGDPDQRARSGRPVVEARSPLGPRPRPPRYLWLIARPMADRDTCGRTQAFPYGAAPWWPFSSM